MSDTKEEYQGLGRVGGALLEATAMSTASGLLLPLTLSVGGRISGATLVGLGLMGLGAYDGWQREDKAITQFDSLREERDALKTKLSEMSHIGTVHSQPEKSKTPL